jgi:superfamily II DNA or RNA helicase
MNTAKLQILDEVNCKFVGLPPDIRRNLYNKSKIFNPALRYTPAVRLGRWDGKTPYFAMGGDTYINLLGPIIEYLASQNYEIDLEDLRNYNRDFQFDPIDNNYLSNHVWPTGHPMAGQPIVMRDHQTEAVNKFLQDQQGIACLPTASGKSLVTAVLSKKIEKYGRSIIIVPNKDLITQTEAYYKILGLDVGVYYGERKDFFKLHTICTWQSLEKLRQSAIDIGYGDPITFQQFTQGVVAIIVDECHGIAAEKLSGMLSKEFAKVPIRWAVTGTIPKEPHQVVNLTISIGEVIHRLATSELQELGILSNCDVKILQMIDTREFTNYAAEYDYLVTEAERLEFVADLVKTASNSGNVLVLVGRKETGKVLESLIPDSIFLSGATKSTTRREHYDEVAVSNKKVIIATSGIAAVGIDIPRLHHLFLFEAGKSFVRTIQSVGRALRTAFDKNHATIWDICSSCRFSKRHLTNRKKFYAEQGFPFVISKVVW